MPIAPDTENANWNATGLETTANLLEEAGVETWAAPLVLVDTDFSLPPKETSTVSFGCELEEDLNLVFLLGHMHEWGTAFSTDHTSGGETTRIYDEPEWKLDYRDEPPMQDFADSSTLIDNILKDIIEPLPRGWDNVEGPRKEPFISSLLSDTPKNSAPRLVFVNLQ